MFIQGKNKDCLLNILNLIFYRQNIFRNNETLMQIKIYTESNFLYKLRIYGVKTKV